ncbi:MAG: ribbon-helix-helix protein, CopG family [Sedimentisphaerales bacterium]|nr:ribbon-helix-helix protein, CopG family [Sedimentisphaerales bacterium]
MDKILSARVDEAIIQKIASLARQMGTTKKKVIEEAVRSYAEKVKSGETDVLELTLGAWSRKESPQQTVAKARKAFRRSMGRRRS